MTWCHVSLNTKLQIKIVTALFVNINSCGKVFEFKAYNKLYKHIYKEISRYEIKLSWSNVCPEKGRSNMNNFFHLNSTIFLRYKYSIIDP